MCDGLIKSHPVSLWCSVSGGFINQGIVLVMASLELTRMLLWYSISGGFIESHIVSSWYSVNLASLGSMRVSSWYMLH